MLTLSRMTAALTLSCIAFAANPADAQLTTSSNLTTGELQGAWVETTVYIPEGSHADEHPREFAIIWMTQRLQNAALGYIATNEPLAEGPGGIQVGNQRVVVYGVFDGMLISSDAVTVQLGVADDLTHGTIDTYSARFTLPGYDGRFIDIIVDLRMRNGTYAVPLLVPLD